ncbi:hypothetical protein BTHI11S_03195 [Bosea thiooxidans]
MSVNDLSGAALAASDGRAGIWRQWLAPLMAASDGLMVFSLVYLAATVYNFAFYDTFVARGRTLELAMMLATLFVFINLMRGRYQITNYLTLRGQMTSAFVVWNITMVAFLVLLFLAKIAGHYSRAVILATYLTGIPVIALSRSLIVRLVVSSSRTGRIAAERVFLIGREAHVMDFVGRHKPWQVGVAIVDVAFLKSAGPVQPGGAGWRPRRGGVELPHEAARRGLHRPALVRPGDHRCLRRRLHQPARRDPSRARADHGALRPAPYRPYRIAHQPAPDPPAVIAG